MITVGVTMRHSQDSREVYSTAMLMHRALEASVGLLIATYMSRVRSSARVQCACIMNVIAMHMTMLGQYSVFVAHTHTHCYIE